MPFIYEGLTNTTQSSNNDDGPTNQQTDGRERSWRNCTSNIVNYTLNGSEKIIIIKIPASPAYRMRKNVSSNGK